MSSQPTSRTWLRLKAGPRGAVFSLGLAALLSGCGQRGAIPDPRGAVQAYAAAAKQGDAAAIYRLMSEEARRTHGEQGARKLVEENKRELLSQGQALAKPEVQIEARAAFQYADGELALIALEDGRFRIASAGAMPSGARTPVQALSELRVALVRRQLAALLQVLSEETRKQIEAELRSLVNGLEHPEVLQISQRGSSASVTLRDGQKILLKREQGFWRVENIQ